MSGERQSTHDVFISYSSKDKKWADAACAVLEKHRVRCWIAPRDITPGTEWGAAIISGMDASRIMVLIFSTHANESAQVRREVERAISKGLVVLPFRVENINPAGAMEYALGNTHWLDGFTKPVERQFDLLARSVESLLSRVPEEVAEPPAPAMRGGLPPYGRLVIAGVVGVLAMIGAVALIGMFRGGRAQPKPVAETFLTYDVTPNQDHSKLGLNAEPPNQGRRKTAQENEPEHQIRGHSAPTDEQRIQGRWDALVVRNGGPAAKQTTKKGGTSSKKQSGKRRDPDAPEHRNEKTFWIFAGPNLTIRRTIDGEERDWVRGTFTVRTVGERKLIDYDSENVNGRRVELRGIYAFDGEFLDVCWRPKTDTEKKVFDRPNSFVVGESNPGTYTRLSRQ
jgi:uncharacterized protein (TIGR03067 family)